MEFDPLSLFCWSPLENMAIAEKMLAKRLGLYTSYSKWGVGQLLYLNLNWNDVTQFIEFDQMNWDDIFAMDFATLASILHTNMIACTSWEEVKRIFDIYQQSWKNRFLISFLCEGVSKRGFIGKPLYHSELFGYKTGLFLGKKPLLDIFEKNPKISLKDVISRIIDKMSNFKARDKILEMLESDQRDLVYPFLLFGSHACASFRKLEKFGGKDAIIEISVPEEIRGYLYSMLISATSSLFNFGPNPKLFHYDDIFSKIKVKELTYFGGDTSICTSPHFVILREEINHFVSAISENQLVRQLIASMPRQGYPIELPDKELTFDRITDSSPPEMPNFIKSQKKKIQERGSRLIINPKWLKILRTKDL